MSFETVADSVKGLIESVRKGPLIAFMLLLMGQNVFQMLRNEKLENRLNDVQDKRVLETKECLETQDRVIGLQDTLARVRDMNYRLVVEMTNKDKK